MRWSGIRYLVWLLSIASLSLVSCTQVDEEDDFLRGDKASLSLTISTATRAETGGVEVINSLRIILLDENGKVEENFYTRITPQSPSPDHIYRHSISTSPGPKRLFVFANEESVKEINSGEQSYTYTSAADLFNAYNPGRSGFENEISKVYFTPDFSFPLPMSCVYDVTVNEDVEEFTAYLVNVANKIEFNINNYRNEKVVFKSIKLDKVADSEYLMANIPESSLNIGGIYWIDWLKAVSDDTNNHPDLDDTDGSNDIINNNWGWMTDYAIPAEVSYNTFSFIPEDSEWEVESSTIQVGSPDPGVLNKGPFYLPESKYQPTDDAQAYSLQLEILQDDGPVKTFTKSLGYVKSLFRNTNVVISVDLSTATEDIYVEIMRWNYQTPSYGTINPE